MVHADDAGPVIRRRRQELGWTQAQLAARVGVSPATVMRWELGRNTPARHQGALEAVLGIRLNGDPYLDPDERQVWKLNLPAATKRRILDILRGDALESRSA